MKIKFDKGFKESLEKVVRKDEFNRKYIRTFVRDIINKIEKATSLMELKNWGIDIRKLKKEVNNAKFRIRKGNYRIGIKVVDDTVVFLWIRKRDEGTYR